METETNKRVKADLSAKAEDLKGLQIVFKIPKHQHLDAKPLVKKIQ